MTDLVDDSVIRSLSESGFVDKTLRSYGVKGVSAAYLTGVTLDIITGKMTASIL